MIQAEQWETIAERMANEFQQRKDYDGSNESLGRRDKLITFLSLLETAGESISKLQSGKASNPLLISRERLATKITTPLAALTLAGLIAQDSKEESDLQKVVSLSSNLQQLVQLASQGKTDQLLVQLDPMSRAGVSLVIPDSTVDATEPDDPNSPTVFDAAKPAYANAPGANIWTKIVEDSKLYELRDRSVAVQRRPASNEKLESSPTESKLDLSEDFDTYKNKRQRKSSELYRKGSP